MSENSGYATHLNRNMYFDIMMTLDLPKINGLFGIIAFCGVLMLSSCARKVHSTHSNNNGSAKANEVVEVAKQYMGVPYKSGGDDRKGMDCSGFVCQVYKEVGVTLPRTSTEQGQQGTRVYIDELQPGDLLFFVGNPGSTNVNHVAIVVENKDGNVSFIHASTSKGVIIDYLSIEYWNRRYLYSKRILVQ